MREKNLSRAKAGYTELNPLAALGVKLRTRLLVQYLKQLLGFQEFQNAILLLDSLRPQFLVLHRLCISSCTFKLRQHNAHWCESAHLPSLTVPSHQFHGLHPLHTCGYIQPPVDKFAFLHIIALSTFGIVKIPPTVSCENDTKTISLGNLLIFEFNFWAYIRGVKQKF